jgi:transposase
MARKLVSDELWALIAPYLPPARPKPKGGRPPVQDRSALTGILFVLISGLPWEMLPQEMGCGSGMTCWRRLRDWQASGVWKKIHQACLDRLGQAGAIDWSRTSLDGASYRAKKGGEKIGPNPTDRGKNGSKRHILVDRNGIPLACAISAANVHDSMMFETLIDAVRPIRQPRGRPRRRPDKLHADKGYDFPRCRRALKQRRIKDRIARRGVEDGKRLGRHRWVVERTLSWLSERRRLVVRYERRADIHQAFLTLGCITICWNVMQRMFC